MHLTLYQPSDSLLSKPSFEVMAMRWWGILLGVCVGLAGQAQEPDAIRVFKQTPNGPSALALAQAGDAVLPFMNGTMEKGGRRAALCAWALWQHPRAGTSGALRGLLLQNDQVAGYWAARALGQLPSDPLTIDALAGLLPDQPLGFWELSRDGRGYLKEAWNKGKRYTIPAPAGMPNLRVAYAALESLAQTGGELAEATLRRALTNDQYLIRWSAARGLAHVRATEAQPALQIMARDDPNLMGRVAAKRALDMIRESSPLPGLSPITTSPLWQGQTIHPAPPTRGILFIKTKNRSESNLGFRDSYFFPKTPRYHAGENLYTLIPPRPDGVLKNLTGLTEGAVQGPELSFDGLKILFSMRPRQDVDGFHIYEMDLDGDHLRQLTSGNCNDVDPCYLPDGRIAFCSDRAGYQEYYHQERSRVIYVMDADGTNLEQITFNPNQDYEPSVLANGRLLYGSYRFYAQDGHVGPLPGERMGLSRIETVLRSVLPDGSGDDMLYGSRRGMFYAPLRPMPFGDQYAGWHPRGYHVGVSISQPRQMDDGRLLCVTPAGLTVVDLDLTPDDGELPIYPEVVNLAGGEEVYIHNYDHMNPVGRYTTPHPLGAEWAMVSHAPWYDLRGNAYGIYRMNLVTRKMELIYDDPDFADVDPIPLQAHPRPLVRSSVRKSTGTDTGQVLCHSVFNSDLPFPREKARYVRVLEALQMGQSINANASFRSRVLGVVPLHPDGSFLVEVPSDTPLRFEILDVDGRMLVHETAFNYVRSGETKGCVGCHEPRSYAPPVTRPMALQYPPARALREPGDLIYFGGTDRPYNRVYRP
jgi:HEAT repeat protein